VHLGVILPNYGRESTAHGVRAVAEAAEELGVDSVWATEHILVGPEAREPFSRVYEPVATLAWISGYTARVGLGTSVVILPLHHPIELAKQAATLQELSGGRLRLGVGVGWHEQEFRFMGVDFRSRDRRADEALRLMRVLWSGETEFSGEYWSFENATFEPLPAAVPEIWVGGGSDRAVRRAYELGDVWHPSRTATIAALRDVKERFPELRIVPRVSGESADEVSRQFEALQAAGAEGVVAGFGVDAEHVVASLRELVPRYR